MHAVSVLQAKVRVLESSDISMALMAKRRSQESVFRNRLERSSLRMIGNVNEGYATCGRCMKIWIRCWQFRL